MSMQWLHRYAGGANQQVHIHLTLAHSPD
jgi:hypothetical protein